MECVFDGYGPGVYMTANVLIVRSFSVICLYLLVI